MILSMLGNKEIGLQFEHYNSDLNFLCTARNLVNFIMNEKTPDENDRFSVFAGQNRNLNFLQLDNFGWKAIWTNGFVTTQRRFY